MTFWHVSPEKPGQEEHRFGVDKFSPQYRGQSAVLKMIIT
jgi:hypothetical protein